MALRKAIELTFRPRTLSDTLDSTNVKGGAMAVLQNLTPALHTPGLFVPRPAATQAANFAGFNTAAAGELLFPAGSRIYGFIQSALNAGKSQPFSYNIANNTFDPISGITSANTPTSTSNIGDWTPPQATRVGKYILMTHPGFDGTTHKFGWLDISTPTAPVWNSGDLTTNPLTAIPTAVGQFNGRSYWGDAGGILSWSDPGNPLVRSNTGGVVQAYTFQNGLGITAIIGQPVTSLTGGIVQALLVFQGEESIQQLTGDQTFAGGLQVNQLSDQTGTVAPNSVVSAPYGTFFMAHDGLRLIGLNGTVSNPIGTNGEGVQRPFFSLVNKTRVSAAYNEDVLRIAVQAIVPPGTQTQNFEYWYYPTLQAWAGPMTFPTALIVASQTDAHFFIFAVAASPIGLWHSEVVAESDTTYVENNNLMVCIYQTSLLPDSGQMNMNAMVQTAMMMALPTNSGDAMVTAIDERRQVIDQTRVKVLAAPGPSWDSGIWDVTLWDQTATPSAPANTSLWDFGVWDVAQWDAAGTPLRQRRFAWSKPLVFKQMSLQVQAFAALNLALGNLYLRYQRLGYMLEETQNAA